MSLDQIRQAKDSKERATLRAKAASEAGKLPTFKVGKHSIAVGTLEHVDDGVRFNLTIKRGSKDFTPENLNPVTIHNPPTLVEDPQGIIESGDRRLRYDPKAALVAAITDLVTSVMEN